MTADTGETMEDFDLEGVEFIEIEVEFEGPNSKHKEFIVFVQFDERAMRPVPGFLRSLRYYMYSNRDKNADEVPKLLNWKFLDWQHPWNECETMLAPMPLDPKDLPDCNCRRRAFERCEKGSLNSRRTPEAYKRMVEKMNLERKQHASS